MSAIAHYTLPELPYARNALEPQISENTINYHYGKHHQTQATPLIGFYMQLCEQPEGGAPLEELIKTATGGVFNNAAQVWNHTFYWNCMTPNKTELKGELKAAIEAKWGSVEQFVEEFSKVTIAHFGSGWSWLVKNEDGSLEILSTGNAANPLRGRY